MLRRLLSRTLGVLGALLAFATLVQAADAPAEIRLDYAYYSPSSLVLKRFGRLEQDLKPSGTTVRWVFSQGSNRSLEYLSSGSVDFGSTALVTHDIDEALYLSDRVVIIGERPGSATAEITVPPPRPRDRRNTVLSALRAQVLNELYAAHAI